MTTTLKMQAGNIEDLRRELEARGFDLRPLPYGHFQARGEDVVVAAYKSGKVVVQGKGEQAFLARQGIEGPAPIALDGPVVGSDESGKGDYFGPLVVAAVVVKPEQVKELQRAGVRDCKKLAYAGSVSVRGPPQRSMVGMSTDLPSRSQSAMSTPLIALTESPRRPSTGNVRPRSIA